MQVTHINCDTGCVEVRDATQPEIDAMRATFEANAAHKAERTARQEEFAANLHVLQQQQPALAQLLLPIIQSSGLQGFVAEG